MHPKYYYLKVDKFYPKTVKKRPCKGEYGISGVAVSVPSIIGRNGIEEIREMAMTDEERDAFLASAETIRNAAATVGML